MKTLVTDIEARTTSKRWLHRFRNSLWLKNLKITERERGRAHLHSFLLQCIIIIVLFYYCCYSLTMNNL